MNVFKIRIVYKSGCTQDFECIKFKINSNGYEWDSYYANGPKPLLLGIEEIAAVWQLDAREVEEKK
jgi:hypothetical protein